MDRPRSRFGSTLTAFIGQAVRSRFSRLILIIFMAAAVSSAGMDESFRINRELLKQAEIRYGKEAATRLLEWEDIIRTTDRSKSDLEKLEIVNQFFNSRVRYASDIEVWKTKDYWATPLEFLCRNAGDCEDFAIAKFFTLKEIGVKEEKLNIMYVKALEYGIAHMVLSYYSTPAAEPLILDNLIDGIAPASKRPDLQPVLGFNGSGLWTAKQRSKGQLPAKSERLKPWRNLQKKLSESKL
ncbi:MAG: transglutaminase-like cysteine peptidase [Desulfobacterales bacterium]